MSPGGPLSNGSSAAHILFDKKAPTPLVEINSPVDISEHAYSTVSKLTHPSKFSLLPQATFTASHTLRYHILRFTNLKRILLIEMLLMRRVVCSCLDYFSRSKCVAKNPQLFLGQGSLSVSHCIEVMLIFARTEMYRLSDDNN